VTNYLCNIFRGRHVTDRDRKVLDWRSRIDKSIARSRAVKGGNYVQLAPGAILTDSRGSNLRKGLLSDLAGEETGMEAT